MEISTESLVRVCPRKGRSSAQWTEITTLGARIVPRGSRELGGTLPAITQTSMVSTWRENMRVLAMESTGIIGRLDPLWQPWIFHSSFFSGLSLLPQNDRDEDQEYETSRLTRVSQEELKEGTNHNLVLKVTFRQTYYTVYGLYFIY